MNDKTKAERKSSESKKSKSLQSAASFDNIDRLFDEFLSRNWLSPIHFNLPNKRLLRAGLSTKLPNVDIIDRGKEVLVRAEIPGFDKKDLKVSMTNTTVTIKGETSKEEREEKGDYYRREISKGSFSRVVSLPCEVVCEKAKSSFANGVLELTAPKAKAEKQHDIKI